MPNKIKLCITLDFTSFVCLSTITGTETISFDKRSIKILETIDPNCINFSLLIFGPIKYC